VDIIITITNAIG